MGCCLQVINESPPTGGSPEPSGEVKSGGLTAWRKSVSDPGCKPLLPQSHQPFQALSYRALLPGLDPLTPWISAQKVREEPEP